MDKIKSIYLSIYLSIYIDVYLYIRKGRGCRDQIVSLMLLGQTKLAIQEDGFLAAFIDFSKAYDRVCRKKLWECLRGYGVSGKFLVMLYTGIVYTLKTQ